MGNAQAAGAIGMGNAFTGGINNGLSAWMYGQRQPAQPISVPNNLLQTVGRYS